MTSGHTKATVDRDGRLHLAVGAGSTASAFTLETVAAGRGTPSSVTSAEPRLQGDGSVVAVRGAALRERFRAHPAGVEQRWELEARPPGDGDLAVRVRPGGATFDGSSGNGLRFADASRSVFFRYDAATWVDASGARRTLDMQLVDGDIEIRVPARLLDESTYPVIFAPIAGAEVTLESPVFIPSSNGGAPSVASDGTNYLVTWAATGGVFAARVSSAGTVQKPERITVATAGTAPRAVWDGGEWYVVWLNNGNVKGARLGSDGTLIDTTPTSIPSASVGSVDLASDGKHVFVAWSASTGQYTSGVYGVLVTPGTTPGAAQPLSTAGISQSAPRVTYDGIEYFVAWQDARGSASIYQQTSDIYAARVSVGGVLVDTSGIAISTATGNQTAPVVASSGSNVFIAWIDDRAFVSGKQPWQLYGARFASATGLIDGPAAAGGITLDTNYDNAPSLAFDGQQYVLSWYNQGSSGAPYSLLYERISTSGVILGSSQAAYSTTVYTGYQNVAVGGSASGSLVTWANSTDVVLANRIDQTGALLDGPSPTGGFPVSFEPSTKTGGTVAFNGTNYLAVWSDDRGGSGVGSIYATRLDGGGTVLDSPAFPIATGRGYMGSISVASNGSGWAVVWNEGGGNVFARLVGPDGSLVNGPTSSDGLRLSATGGPPVIASDGTDYLCLWSDSRGSPPPNSGTTYSNIYGMRFSQTALVKVAADSGDGSFLVASGNYEWYVSVGFDGTNYLMIWYDANGYSHGFGSRLTPSGQRLDNPGFSVAAAATSGACQANNGTSYLVASSANVDLVVPPNGAVAQSNPNFQNLNSACYDGRSFWLFQTGSGIRVRDDLSIVDTTPLGDQIGTYNSFFSAASDGLGDFLVTYPSGNDARARVVIDDDRNGAPCAVGDFCASGVCEDGVCCEHSCGGSTSDCRACSVAAGGTTDGKCAAATTGHVCRPGSACELTGTCDGITTACPPDYYLPPNTVCGDAGACTAAPLCSGTSATCNSGQPVANGTSCGVGATCNAGVCVTPVPDAGAEAGAEAGVLDAGGEGGSEGGAPVEDAGNDAGAAEAGRSDAGAGDASAGAGDAAIEDSGNEAMSDGEGPSPDSGQDGSVATLDAGAEPPADATSDAPGAMDGGGAASGGNSGCGCRVATRGADGGGWAGAVLAVGFLGARLGSRRKRRPGRQVA